MSETFSLSFPVKGFDGFLGTGVEIGDVLQWDGTMWAAGCLTSALCFDDLPGDPPAPGDPTMGKLYKKAGSTGIWWRTSTTLTNLTSGGGGGGTLQDAYDAGSNILTTSQKPVVIRTGGIEYGELPFIGLLVDASGNPTDIPLGVILDANSDANRSCMACFREIVDEFISSPIAPTPSSDIDISGAGTPAWVPIAMADGATIVMFIKGADVPTDDGVYYVSAIDPGLTVATLIDLTTFVPATFTSISFTAMFMQVFMSFGQPQGHIIFEGSPIMSQPVPIVGNFINASNGGNNTSLQNFIQLTNSFGSVMQGAFIHIENQDPTTAEPLIKFNDNQGTASDMQLFPRLLDPTALVSGSFWYDHISGVLKYIDNTATIRTVATSSAGTNQVVTVGFGGDYATVTAAILDSKYIMILISDTTEPGGLTTTIVRMTTIFMDNYTINTGDGNFILGSNHSMNLVGPGTLQTTRVGNSVGGVVGNGVTPDNSFLYAHSVYFQIINGGVTNNVTRNLVVQLVDCKFDVYNNGGGGFINTFDALGNDSYLERCHISGLDNFSVFEISSPPARMRFIDCLVSGQFDGTTPSIKFGTFPVTGLRVELLSVVTGEPTIEATHIDTLINSGLAFSIAMPTGAGVRPFYKDINLVVPGLATAGAFIMSDSTDGTLINCRFDRIDFGTSLRHYFARCSWEPQLANFNISSQECIWEGCRFAQVNVGVSSTINASDNYFTDCTFFVDIVETNNIRSFDRFTQCYFNGDVLLYSTQSTISACYINDELTIGDATGTSGSYSIISDCVIQKFKRIESSSDYSIISNCRFSANSAGARILGTRTKFIGVTWDSVGIALSIGDGSGVTGLELIFEGCVIGNLGDMEQLVADCSFTGCTITLSGIANGIRTRFTGCTFTGNMIIGDGAVPNGNRTFITGCQFTDDGATITILLDADDCIVSGCVIGVRAGAGSIITSVAANTIVDNCVTNIAPVGTVSGNQLF